MVPVKMRQKNVEVHRPISEFSSQKQAQVADACSTIEHENVTSGQPDFDARRVPTKFQVLELRRRDRAPHSPESQPHPKRLAHRDFLSSLQDPLE